MYRNDLCCKRKVAYDMESAAERWDTHPGGTIYVCDTCGFVHFARNNEPRMDRSHARALRIEARRNAVLMGLVDRGSNKKVWPKLKEKQRFSTNLPLRYGGGGTCRIDVWKASTASIGDILAAKRSP